MTLLKILSGVFFVTFTFVFLLQAVACSLQDVDFAAFWALVPGPFQIPLSVALFFVVMTLVAAGTIYLMTFIDNLGWFD